MKVEIDLLQPGEKVLSERKLAKCRWKYYNEVNTPNHVSITPFDGRFVIRDGNHTTYVYYEAGKTEIEANLQEHGDTSWIPGVIKNGVTKIADLSDRIISHDEWRKMYPGCDYEDDCSDEIFFSRHPELKEYLTRIGKK